MVEINFLCVKPQFRSKRLAPVLIKEVTRRTHKENIWQAVYTAGVLLPKPFCEATYFHRSINIEKLLDIQFTYLNPLLSKAKAKIFYKVAKVPTIDGIREMTVDDIDEVYTLLREYLDSFKVHTVYSKEEIKHWFIPRKGVVYSYVIEDPETSAITDFISFYSLPSTLLKHEVHKTLKACYSFFNFGNKNTIKNLLKNALILANKLGFDVFNALNIMENETVFTDLLFGKGSGTLKYYFYNFMTPEIKPNELGIVLM